MITAERTILVAEDDENDVLFLRRSFKIAQLSHSVHFVPDGQEAIDFLLRQRLEAEGRLPALVILDLKMPRKSGLEVLCWIKGQTLLRALPVVIFSSSNNRNDVENAYANGANGFIVKPSSILDRDMIAKFFKDWLTLNELPLVSLEGYKSAQSRYAAKTPGPAAE